MELLLPEMRECAFYEAAMNQSHSPKLLLDHHKSIVGVNAAFLSALEYSSNEVFDKKAFCNLCYYKPYQNVYDSCFYCHIFQTPHYPTEIEIVTKLKQRKHFVVINERFKWEGGKYMLLSFFSPLSMNKQFSAILDKLDDWANELYPNHPEKFFLLYEKLTKREKEILEKIGEGNPNKKVSEELNISVKTVEVHKSNILNKLQLKDTNDLIKYAFSRKFISIYFDCE